jgi:uncharacterized protein
MAVTVVRAICRHRRAIRCRLARGDQTLSVYPPTVRLGDEQIRVLGCLLEKQRTTPDAYPLTLNALRMACNQSTNRDPVVHYDESVIREALRGLERRGLTRLASGAGSRAPKYRHLLDETLPLSAQEKAIICTLMLRGAQTPGELKQRGERMHEFADLAAVHRVLEALIERELVARVGRRPGQKEERYAQLLGGEVEDAERAPVPTPDTEPQADSLALEQRVARLERELAELKARMGMAPAADPG